MIGVSKVSVDNGKYENWYFWIGQGVLNTYVQSEPIYASRGAALFGLRQVAKEILDNHGGFDGSITVWDGASQSHLAVDMETGSVRCKDG